ncbi:putative ankyrin repeat-containing domain-containing protein [Lupinus albus]|uniref:Putative ankyrin repeat-containing domain-containing protein n=1 Tax=Lupinus albus TaxID=3870 RepID=A0A6A4PEG2_LUPAL|nr:putative ankyrin repeat-containing domain-containing protein [Lupinus albus]
MTVFSAKQVFPVDYEPHVSQLLLQASHSGDLTSVFHCISDPSVDVNFSGAVTLKTRNTDLILFHESATQVCVQFHEFVTDVTPLFLAVHAGNASLVRKLLVMQQRFSLFRSVKLVSKIFELCYWFSFRFSLMSRFKCIYAFFRMCFQF